MKQNLIYQIKLLIYTAKGFKKEMVAHPGSADFFRGARLATLLAAKQIGRFMKEGEKNGY